MTAGIGRVLGGLARLVALAGLLGAAVLAAGFVLFVVTLDDPSRAPPRHAQGVVALTGGADRVIDAVGLLARGHAERLLITGVNPDTTAPEIARLAPGARALFGCCIELGYAAANTVGNALETSRWVRRHAIRSLIVVTSDYHMPRALAEIAHAAPGVDLTAFPVVAERDRAGGRLRTLAWEYLKYVAVLARLHVASGIPASLSTDDPREASAGERTEASLPGPNAP